jgi:hypothetical protein
MAARAALVGDQIVIGKAGLARKCERAFTRQQHVRCDFHHAAGNQHRVLDAPERAYAIGARPLAATAVDGDDRANSLYAIGWHGMGFCSSCAQHTIALVYSCAAVHTSRVRWQGDGTVAG